MNSAVFVKLFVLILIVLRTYVCCVFVLPPGENGGGMGDTGTLRYEREFLLNLQAAGDTVVVNNLVFGEVIRARESEKTGRRKTERKRGRRGSVRRRLRKNCFQPPLPSMILSNVRSVLLNSKNSHFTEICASCQFLTEFRNSCLVCFTETFFNEKAANETYCCD